MIGMDLSDVEDAAMEEWFPDFQIDPDYEFSAPHFFDFIQGETEEEAQQAEGWFETASTYAASPYVAKIKERESSHDEIKCSLHEDQHVEICCPAMNLVDSAMNNDVPSSNQGGDMTEDMDLCTPKGQVNVKATQLTVKRIPPFSSKSTLTKPTASHLAKRLDSSIRGAKEVKNTKQDKARCIKDVLLRKEKAAQKSAAEDNQAVKRQKLEGGRLHQVINVKEQHLPHKAPSKLSVSKEPLCC